MTDLPPGWEHVAIDEVAEVQGGIQKQAKRRPARNKYPFLRVANVSRGSLNLTEVHEIELFDGELERFTLQPGDLLVVEGNGSPTEIGRAARWRGEISDCVHQNHLIRVRPLSRLLNSHFLELLWNSPAVVNQLQEVARSTSGLYTLSTSKVKSVRIPLPPFEEQHRVAATLDEHLSRLAAATTCLEASTQRLSLLAKRVLVEAVPIPAPPHWKMAKVEEAGKVELGRQRHPDWHNGPNMRPYLRVANVFEDRIDTTDLMEMDFPPEIFERFRLIKGDVLLNEGQSPEYLGRPAMYRGIPEEVAFTNSLLRFQAGAGVLPEWALLVFRRHMHAGRFMREIRITTNIAHLSATRLKSVEFPIPPVDEQERIVDDVQDKLESINRLASSVDVASRRAEGLRRSVLTEAFAGRFVPQDPGDVPAAELLAKVRAEQGGALKPRDTRRTRTKAASKPTINAVQETLL